MYVGQRCPSDPEQEDKGVNKRTNRPLIAHLEDQTRAEDIMNRIKSLTTSSCCAVTMHPLYLDFDVTCWLAIVGAAPKWTTSCCCEQRYVLHMYTVGRRPVLAAHRQLPACMPLFMRVHLAVTGPSRWVASSSRLEDLLGISVAVVHKASTYFLPRPDCFAKTCNIQFHSRPDPTGMRLARAGRLPSLRRTRSVGCLYPRVSFLDVLPPPPSSSMFAPS